MMTEADLELIRYRLERARGTRGATWWSTAYTEDVTRLLKELEAVARSLKVAAQR